jgi:hypothetical protein
MVKNRSVFMKTGKTSLGKPAGEYNFFKKFDFFEKWFTGFGTGLLVITTGKLVLLAGLPVSAGFNHYRPTSFWFRYRFTSHIDSFTNF